MRNNLILGLTIALCAYSFTFDEFVVIVGTDLRQEGVGGFVPLPVYLTYIQVLNVV